MPLQIRRGSTAQRLTITPLPGELIYDTTTGQLYVGDGTTVGGATTTGISLEDARDAAAALLTSGVHSGITFSYNDTLDRIDATVTIGGIGPFDGDINGSVFADDSTLLVDGTSGQIRGPLNTSGTTQTITTTAGADQNGLTIVGENLSYTKVRSRLKVEVRGVSANTDHGFSVDHYENSAIAARIALNKSRGSPEAPTAVSNNDAIGDVWFIAHEGVNFAAAGRFGMQAVGAPVAGSGLVSAKYRFQTSDGSSFTTKAEISPTGVFQVNSIQNLTGSSLSLTATDVNVNGNLVSTGTIKGSSLLASDNSTIVDGSSKNVSASALSFSNYLQSAIYVDELNRNTSIPSPAQGMVVFVQSSDDGGPMLSVNTDGTLPGWENIVTFDRLLSGIPSTLERDIKGSVFLDNSTRIIDGESGNITGSAIISTNYVQFPVYADVATRNATIPNPSAGMVTFVTDNGSGLPRLQVNTDGTNGGWVDLH